MEQMTWSRISDSYLLSLSEVWVTELFSDWTLLV